MYVINFFGGPGAGKSTAAAGLFYEMKKHWITSEYIQEYAKELVWSDNEHMLSEQNYIFAEQEHRLNRLRTKVSVAITDSPLLLSSFYAPADYPKSFHESVFDFFSTYDNLNILVKRSHEYSSIGRLQEQEDADKISDKMEQYLQDNGIKYLSITASDASPTRIMTWLVDNKLVHAPPANMPWKKDPPPEGWMTSHIPETPWFSGRPIIKANLVDVKTVGDIK